MSIAGWRKARCGWILAAFVVTACAQAAKVPSENAPGDASSSGLPDGGSGAEADAGDPFQKVPTDYPDAGSACPNGDGEYCGQTLGLDPTKLYACKDGQIAVAQACAGQCVIGADGVADACPCPDGDGLYCGDRLGRDPQTLYDCEKGQILVSATCPGICVDGTNGSEDACSSCPDGNGLYCGSRLQLDANVLYDCEDGVVSSKERCPGACQVNPAGLPDACSGCPNGDGLYCGSEVGADPSTLYHCASGALTVADHCANGCQHNGGGTPDACKATSCPSGNGLYCGSEVGKDASTLYQCTDGNVTAVQQCSNGCQVNGGGTADACKPSCPSGNGLYCGSEVGEDANTLYQCTDGTLAVAQRCSSGCQVNSAGSADACKSTTSCPSGNGLYCGSEVGKDASTLYQCTDGAFTVAKTCASGCHQSPAGVADYCNGTSCPAGNGLYCGSEVGANANTLYDCNDGTLTVHEQCANGCQVNSAGIADACKSGSCPSGNGLYCGSEVGADSNTLYDCDNGALTVSQRCANGCQVNPAGQEDQCKQVTCPSGNGLYCGAEVGGDANTLYDCANGTLTVAQACPSGCQANAAGTPDQCKSASCPSGNGLYCGSEVGADQSTLYQCTNGSLTVSQKCANGCQVNPSGQEDQCKTASCPSGNGVYCGSEVGADQNTLYQCTNGGLTTLEKCANGCQVNPPGQQDQCKAAACPSGNGLYCGSEVGAEPSTLYTCTNGTLAVSQRCANGCQVNPPGQQDQCRATPCPSGDGLYCGSEVGADQNTLYRCQSGRLSVQQVCASRCQVNPPGTPDACAGGSCPAGDGLYCGSEVGANANTLYQCTNGRLSTVRACPAGCAVEPAGTPDQCNAGSCDAYSREALAWEAKQLAEGHSYSDYCLAFVSQAFRYGAGVTVRELQKATAADSLDAYRAEGKLHPWAGTAPCGVILFWDRNRRNGYAGHIVISNGDGTVSTSGWPGFGGSTHASISWLDNMECGNRPAGYADPP